MIGDDFGRPWNSAEPSESYRKWFPLFLNHATFDAVGFRETKIGLPPSATLGLKKKVLAAAIAYGAQLSLNYAEKRYVEGFEVSTPRDPGLNSAIDDLFDNGLSLFHDNFDALNDVFSDDTDTQDGLSNQFFYRNLASLEAAKKLSDLGYLCEVAVILRSFLEQLAFSAKLRTLPNSVDIEKTKPIQCLNLLKSIEPAAGRLYGLLSKYTHFEFDHHTRFFGRSPGANFTIHRDSVLRAYSVHLIFMTMLSTARYVMFVAPNQFEAEPDSVTRLSEFCVGIAKYSEEVRRLFPTDKVLANFDLAIQNR